MVYRNTLLFLLSIFYLPLTSVVIHSTNRGRSTRAILSWADIEVLLISIHPHLRYLILRYRTRRSRHRIVAFSALRYQLIYRWGTPQIREAFTKKDFVEGIRGLPWVCIYFAFIYHLALGLRTSQRQIGRTPRNFRCWKICPRLNPHNPLIEEAAVEGERRWKLRQSVNQKRWP